MLSESEWDVVLLTVVDDCMVSSKAVEQLRAHDREQRKEIERLKVELETALTAVDGFLEQQDKDNADLSRLRDAARVRDARTEKPAPDQRVLLWGRDHNAPHRAWTIDWWLQEGECFGWMWGHYPHDHFWLPMPPAPEVKP